VNFELHSERQAYSEVLEHEVKKIVRVLRAFPAERFEQRDPECLRSARELAGEFVAHVRGIEEISHGRIAPNLPAASRTRGGILLELETAAMGASAALMTLSPARWGEVMEAPTALTPWRQARRGELLWLALREMVHHYRHFTLHLKAARPDDGVGRVRAASGREPLDALMFGA
jgi:hypothetical protein